MQLRTKELCAAAFQQTPMALKDIPSELVTDAIHLTAVEDRGVALEHVPEECRTEAICLAAVNASPRALAYVPEGLRSKCVAAMQENRAERSNKNAAAAIVSMGALKDDHLAMVKACAESALMGAPKSIAAPPGMGKTRFLGSRSETPGMEM